MSNWLMAKRKYYKLKVYDSSEHSITEVLAIFKQLFGFEDVQALSCIGLIQSRGSYVCKEFKDVESAHRMIEVLQQYGLTATVV